VEVEIDGDVDPVTDEVIEGEVVTVVVRVGDMVEVPVEDPV
jgi:hypothetical protein